MNGTFRLVLDSRGTLCLFDQATKLSNRNIVLHPNLEYGQGQELLASLRNLFGGLRFEQKPEWLVDKVEQYGTAPVTEEGELPYRELRITVTTERIMIGNVPQGKGPIVVLFINKVTETVCVLTKFHRKARNYAVPFQ